MYMFEIVMDFLLFMCTLASCSSVLIYGRIYVCDGECVVVSDESTSRDGARLLITTSLFYRPCAKSNEKSFNSRCKFTCSKTVQTF